MRDPVEIEIFANLYHSIAEEMGAALRRTAFSPNIKERRDYSCAVFDADGEVIAMGDHMPVHLGSMPMSVRAAVEKLTLGPGDVAILNYPFCGGTHLPDITLVAPVFLDEKKLDEKKSKPGRKFHRRCSRYGAPPPTIRNSPNAAWSISIEAVQGWARIGILTKRRATRRRFARRYNPAFDTDYSVKREKRPHNLVFETQAGYNDDEDLN